MLRETGTMLWDTIRESLQESLSNSEYTLWIKPLACQHQDDKVLELTGPDRYFCSWVQDRYLDLIKAKLHELAPGNRHIHLSVANQPALQLRGGPAEQLRLPGIRAGATTIRSLHPGYTFDQFMVGESNLLATSACRALARGENTFGHCLFINSSPGLGKSHLTQAVVHSILDHAPSTMMHYLTAQQFSAEMVKGIRNKKMEQFSKKYVRNCDIMLVEDVHTLTGKNKTQEELNTILDYLIKSGRRVILTAAVAPRQMKGIDADLRSRMTSGLVTKIKDPDYETRVNIIRHKAAGKNLVLDDDLIDLLAHRLHGDIRKTESAIIGIKGKACLLNTPPDRAMIDEVLQGLVGNSAELNAEIIRDFVGCQFKVSVDDLQSRSRKRAVTFPRQVAMYLTRKYTDQSLADIGQLYNRDHSTVLHAIRVVTQNISRKTTVREQVKLLCRKLKESA